MEVEHDDVCEDDVCGDVCEDDVCDGVSDDDSVNV